MVKDWEQNKTRLQIKNKMKVYGLNFKTKQNSFKIMKDKTIEILKYARFFALI